MTTQEGEITGIHRWPLLGALGVVLFTLVIVVVSVIAGKEPVGSNKQAIEASASQARDLFFRDGASGEVLVYDASTKRLISSFGKGEGAFVRISMRGLVRDRINKNIKLSEPFRLISFDDGNIRIVDPSSGSSIRINAFGAVAINSFKQFLSTTHSEQGAEG